MVLNSDLWTLRPFGEQVYSALRIKPNIETVFLALIQSSALSSTVVSCHLDLINRLPSFSLLDLIDHVPEFDRADITTKEHALALYLFPVIPPCGLADSAALLRNFQTVYSSPNAPSNTGQNSKWIEETSPAHHPHFHTT